MCQFLNRAKTIAKITKIHEELSDEQFNRYEELDNEAELANKSSMAAAHVRQIYDGISKDNFKLHFKF